MVSDFIFQPAAEPDVHHRVRDLDLDGIDGHRALRGAPPPQRQDIQRAQERPEEPRQAQGGWDPS